MFGPLFFPAAVRGRAAAARLHELRLAFVARPVGAIAFGHFGDRIGRKSTLVASLLLMGGSTLLIAFLPTYAMAGWVAPLLLCVLRFGQGFGLGGEWGGAALLAVENAPTGWEARFGMAPAARRAGRLPRRERAVPAARARPQRSGFHRLGLALAVPARARCWSASGCGCGCGSARRPRSRGARARRRRRGCRSPAAAPVISARSSPATAGVVAAFAIFYLATASRSAQADRHAGYPRETFLAVQLGAILFMALGIVLAAIGSPTATSPRRD